MQYWRVNLCEELQGWYWECRNEIGGFVCRSPRHFKKRWQALKNFEDRFEDHWAAMWIRTAA